ncbi:phosphate system cyclin PHO80 [Rhodotorula toruloides]|uniref:Phosphate system cyclin PHO80 n=1 Tax=Rhodotorula toruloides TaxID=5286 RepID=A0A511KIC2_RHOTO|nr:phosphate system cyclin PHO80 [Rhodotorula toruloides]
MGTRPDPTNANAVPGPSRAPFVPSASSQLAPSTSSAHPDSHAVQAAGAAPSAPGAQGFRKDPVRRADGPIIVKTVVSGDGVREVPTAFEHCEVEDLITLIASMLDRLIEHNDRIPLTSNSLTRFHSRAPPNISVRDYLSRIAKYTNVEPCCLLILLPYVDKVCTRMSSFTISSLTVHRFIIAAISVGSKALSDAFCTNGRYARVGGVSIVEMNLLEKEFCEALDWRLTTSGPVLAHYYTSLVRSHPSYRLSTAGLPSPPPPPPIVIPPPLEIPLSPVTASNPPHSLPGETPMDVDTTSAPGTCGSSFHADPVEKPSPSPPSPSPGRSDASSSVSPSTGSSISRSTSNSIASSPQRGRTRGRERPPSSFKPVGPTISLPQPPEGESMAPPPLVPPDLKRASASASHLPSPARPPHPPPPPEGGPGIFFPTTVNSSLSVSHSHAHAVTNGGSLSPAKRGRGRSGSGESERKGELTRGGREGLKSPRLSNGGDAATVNGTLWGGTGG